MRRLIDPHGPHPEVPIRQRPSLRLLWSQGISLHARQAGSTRTSSSFLDAAVAHIISRRNVALNCASCYGRIVQQTIMSHPSHSKLVEVWNPDQKSFYTACLLDIDEGLFLSRTGCIFLLDVGNAHHPPPFRYRHGRHPIHWQPRFAKDTPRYSETLCSPRNGPFDSVFSQRAR
jgi:hypothetical protein